ncbi:MAG TPA: hypothetical protein VKV95_15340 [Terriglobia bacterium]|nr:hypothetical protein [Terriglobia bacterium]
MTQSRAVSTKKPLSAWKIIRWFVLAALLVVFLLILKKPRPVAEPMPPAVAKEKSEEFQSKMQVLAESHSRGQSAEARFNADEVNAAFQQSAAEQSAPPALSAPPAPSDTDAIPETRTVQIAFVDDHATGQFVADFHGKDVYLTVSGKIGVADGYATFEFTEARIGDMPVPVSLLNPKLQAKLQAPENHEKLKLPDYVAGLRIENGQLVIVEK